MNTKKAITGLLAITLVGLVACKTPRQRCYESNRCDSADAECLGIMAMLTGMMSGGSTLDTSTNSTLNGATQIPNSGATTINGSLATSSDAYDVYYVTSDTPSVVVSATMTASAGSPACTMFKTSSKSYNTNANPLSVAQSNFTVAGTLSSSATTVDLGWGYYAYIVCAAGSTADTYTLSVTSSGSSAGSSSFLMLMCLGSGATCEATCNTQYSY